MRLGVVDVGSNTVHLLVVDAHPGARPLPENSHKIDLRLAEHLDVDGNIAASGVDALCDFLKECLKLGEDRGVEEILPFATSAIRESPNGEYVLRAVAERTGVQLRVLTGGQEAELTFLAVRRWYGWSRGRILLFDIGGGSLEMATGTDEVPDTAISVPLGAGRVTRNFLQGDPPTPDDIREARRVIRAEVAKQVSQLNRLGEPDHAVGTSKTFRSLARLTGAAPSSDGPGVVRQLHLADLSEQIEVISGMTYAQRCELPGVSASRAPQLLGGALVAEAAMDLMGVQTVDICPWALREGLILRRIDAEGTSARFATEGPDAEGATDPFGI